MGWACLADRIRLHSMTNIIREHPRGVCVCVCVLCVYVCVWVGEIEVTEKVSSGKDEDNQGLLGWIPRTEREGQGSCVPKIPFGQEN